MNGYFICEMKFVQSIDVSYVFLQNSKIKFPLPHRIIKSEFSSKFMAKRPNTFYF